MRHKIKLLFLLLVTFSSTLYAAPVSISGVVVDRVTNEAVIGATIVVEGTTTGSVTSYDGGYTISVEPGQTITFNYLGYVPQSVKIGANTKVDIFLYEDTEQIDEILVVGYGVQKKSSSVGSIAQVSGEDILKSGSTTSISQAIQGAMPGVVATVNSSKPGSEDATVYIRGVASWQDSTPLYLVDGVERDINDIDPNEIESLSVLKDASATAVYGVKGANGVILVTTKRGTVSKPKVNFSTNFGFKKPTNIPEYADYVTTMEMWNEAAANDLAWDSVIPQSTIDAWRQAYASGEVSSTSDYFPEVDWWDEALADYGFSQQYNVNVSGGTEFVKYFASLGYLNDGDIFDAVESDLYDASFYYKRYNWRTNFDFSLTPSTTFSVNLAGSYGNRNQAGYRVDGDTEDGWGETAFYSTLYSAPSHLFPVTWSDGYYGVASDGTGNVIRSYLDRGQRTYKYYQHFIDLKFNQDLSMLTKGLSASAKFSYTASTTTDSYIQKYEGGTFGPEDVAYYREYDYTSPTSGGGYDLLTETRWTSEFIDAHQAASYDGLIEGGYSKNIYYEFALNYARTFGDHDVTGLLVMNRNEKSGLESSSTTNLQFVEKDEAWVGRVTYGYKGRYLAEVNGAYTGSQKFAPGLRFDFFPSYSVGWRISEEPIIKNAIGTKLNNLKVRYSYGKVGYDKSADEYSYIQTYSATTSNAVFGYYDSTNYGVLYTEGELANTSATWETATKQNLGIEFKIFDKFSGSVDFFKEDREGILMNVSNPEWVGVDEANANLGVTKSRGYELEFTWMDNIGEDFRYWLKGNYSFNENRVVYRNDARLAEEYTTYAGKSINYQSRYYNNGYYTSLDDIYNGSTTWTTATQSTLVAGDLIYLDYNCDGVIDSSDMVPVDYNTYPQKTYGGSIGFAYKNFEVNALFYGVLDVYKNLNTIFAFDLSDGNSGNYFANPDVVDRWTADTADSASKPALHAVAANGSYSESSSTYLYQNASYFTLQNIELSYRFNGAKIKRLGLNTLQLYVSGYNLWMLTPFNDQTSPVSNSNTVYPIVKRYNVGARLSF